MFLRDPTTATIGKEILPLECSHLPEFFQEKARVELNDTPERREEAVKQLRILVENEKLFQEYTFTEAIALQFLRARKYNVDKTFSQMKYAAKFKSNHSQIFSNFRFENTVKTIKDEIFTVLPWRCQDGCAILLAQIDNWYPDRFSIEEVKKMVLVIILQSLRYPMTQVNGFKVIFDVKSNPVRHLRYVTPYNIYLLYYGTQEVAPGRFKGIHIVGDSITYRAAWAILQFFLPAKLKKRFVFHSTVETLLDYFPRDVLPLKYGGTLQNYDLSDWLEKMMKPEELAASLGHNLSESSKLMAGKTD